MENTSILIVDDEKNIRLTMLHTLEQLNIPVQTAINGEEALQKLADRQFEIVFLDLKMPGIDGLEVFRRIIEKWPQIWVVIITAYGTIKTVVEAMKLGAVDFIQKPFSSVEIRTLVSRLLESEIQGRESLIDFPTLLDFAKNRISDSNFATASEMAIKAITANSANPQACMLVGTLLEINGDLNRAEKFYRAAIHMDTNLIAARANRERILLRNKYNAMVWGQKSERRNGVKFDACEDSDGK